MSTISLHGGSDVDAAFDAMVFWNIHVSHSLIARLGLILFNLNKKKKQILHAILFIKVL